MSRPGHHVLVVPVPELEDVVRARWEHYDPAWVSTDPDFTHAHITALAPFLATPHPTDLTRIGELCAETPAFDFTLDEVEVFPNGCVHLKPTPSGPFADLTRRLHGAFPMCPPYGGEYDVVPHLTLDQLAADVTMASTRALLGDAVPATCRAGRLELHWYQAGGAEVRRSWPLRRVDPESAG